MCQWKKLSLKFLLMSLYFKQVRDLGLTRIHVCVCLYTFTFVLSHQQMCTFSQAFGDRQKNLPLTYVEFELFPPLHELGTFFCIFQGPNLDFPGTVDPANWGNIWFPQPCSFPFPTSLGFLFLSCFRLPIPSWLLFLPFKGNLISKPSFIFSCSQLGKGIPKTAGVFTF